MGSAVAWLAAQLRRWGCLGLHAWGDPQIAAHALWLVCDRCGTRTAGWTWTPAYRGRLAGTLTPPQRDAVKRQLARAFDAWHNERRRDTSDVAGPVRRSLRRRLTAVRPIRQRA